MFTEIVLNVVCSNPTSKGTGTLNRETHVPAHLVVQYPKLCMWNDISHVRKLISIEKMRVKKKNSKSSVKPTSMDVDPNSGTSNSNSGDGVTSN